MSPFAEHPAVPPGRAMSRFVIVLLLACIAGAAGAQATPPSAPAANVRYGWAEVLRVDPVYAPVPQTVPDCRTPDVAHQASGPARAIAGHGSAKRPAAAASTGHAGTIPCRPLDTSDPQQQIVAYDVEYRYRGDVYVSRLPFDPGERMRVRVTVAPAAD